MDSKIGKTTTFIYSFSMFEFIDFDLDHLLD